MIHVNVVCIFIFFVNVAFSLVICCWWPMFLEIGAGSQTFASIVEMIIKRIDRVICGQRVYLKITHIRASIWMCTTQNYVVNIHKKNIYVKLKPRRTSNVFDIFVQFLICCTGPVLFRGDPSIGNQEWYWVVQSVRTFHYILFTG